MDKNQRDCKIEEEARSSPHQGKLPTMSGSQKDCKLVLGEVCAIMQIENDPVTLIDYARKIQQVLKAVPRMENFIQSICLQVTIAEDVSERLPLE